MDPAHFVKPMTLKVLSEAFLAIDFPNSTTYFMYRILRRNWALNISRSALQARIYALQPHIYAHIHILIEAKPHHPIYCADVDNGAKMLGKNHHPMMVSWRFRHHRFHCCHAHCKPTHPYHSSSCRDIPKLPRMQMQRVNQDENYKGS